MTGVELLLVVVGVAYGWVAHRRRIRRAARRWDDVLDRYRTDPGDHTDG